MSMALPYSNSSSLSSILSFGYPEANSCNLVIALYYSILGMYDQGACLWSTTARSLKKPATQSFITYDDESLALSSLLCKFCSF